MIAILYLIKVFHNTKEEEAAKKKRLKCPRHIIFLFCLFWTGTFIAKVVPCALPSNAIWEAHVLLSPYFIMYRNLRNTCICPYIFHHMHGSHHSIHRAYSDAICHSWSDWLLQGCFLLKENIAGFPKSRQVPKPRDHYLELLDGFWNLTDGSAVLLRSRLSNFKAIQQI